MKPFILVLLPVLLGSNRPSRNSYMQDDFGLFMMRDQKGKNEIVIKSSYYVTEGKADDLRALQLGVDFWHAKNGQFFLVVMDSNGKLKNDFMAIRFELEIFSCKDPLAMQDINDSLGRKKLPGYKILNTFLLVDTIKNGVRECRVKNPDESAGLTCGVCFTRVKRKFKDSVNVVAHEIGHTLGLEHLKIKKALMYADTSAGKEVYEFEVRQMLDHAYRHRENWYRNHFDRLIPRGKVVHVSGRDPEFPELGVEFLKKDQPPTRRKISG